MKHRYYYNIEGRDPADPAKLNYSRRDIECDDTFDGDLVMLTFPISLMKEISSVLSHFHLRSDPEYFYSECKEVVSVPEKHVNEKGEGKLTFQSYFHKFPESVQNFFDDALIVVVLHPQPGSKDKDNMDYNMIAYINVNHINFKSPDGHLHKGYYYNILRMREQAQYRRKRVFTTMFSILLDLVTLHDIHFVYASMGRENQAINDALKMNSERNGKFFETFPMRNNSHVNLFLGSKSAAGKLVDISKNKEALHEYYLKIQETRGTQVFNQMHSEENFLSMVKRILGSSDSSKIYMMPDEKGKMAAAGFFINWGDYMHLKLQNPKGIFKLVDYIQISDKILYPILLVGDEKKVKEMVSGAAYKFRTEHKVHVTVLNALNGDPYYEMKKSLISDPFVYFVIYDKPETYQAMKDYSKDAQGNIRIFIDTPML